MVIMSKLTEVLSLSKPQTTILKDVCHTWLLRGHSKSCHIITTAGMYSDIMLD